MSDIYQGLNNESQDSSSIYSSLKPVKRFEMPEYTLPITDDESVFISNILQQSKDVENDKYAIASAIFYARQYQKPVSHILQNLDAYNEMWLNTKSTIHKNNWVAIMDAAKAGLVNEELTNVAMAWQKSGGTDKLAEARLDELSKELEGLQDKVPRPWYVDALKAGLQTAPFTLGAMAAGLAGSISAMGGAYGLMNAYGIPVGELAGPAMPAISLAVIGALGVTGAYAGSSSYITPRVSALEYYRMRKNGINDTIAQPVAAISSGLQTITELCLGNVAGLLSKIGGKQAVSTISGNILKKIATKNILTPAARALTGYIGEAGEEALEEGVQQFTSSLADIISAEIQKEGVDQPTAGQVTTDIISSMKDGFLASLVLGIPGTVIGFKGDVQESRTLSDMARSLDEKDFIRIAKDQNFSMISGLREPQQDDVLTKIWAAQQERVAEIKKGQPTLTTDEQIAKAESETQPTKKVPSQAIKRLPDGRLYTADVVEQETGEDTAVGMIKAGDPTPGSGKRYGYIQYTETEDSVIVDSLKSEPGYSAIKRDLILELAAKKPGKDIEWNPKSKELQTLKAQIEAENPRGKEFGLQWFDVDQEAGVVIARQDLKSKLKKWMPRLNDVQRDAAIELLNVRATAKGLSLDQYLDKYHTKEVFSSNPDVQAAQGKKGGVSFKDVEGEAKALIYVTENSDFSTWAHENAHIFRRQLEGDLKTEAETVYGVSGAWTREQEEKFATDFEKYLYEGTAPTPKLKTLFQKIASWMRDIYKALTGKIDIDPRIKVVFDKLLTDNKEAFQEVKTETSPDISQTLFQKGLLQSAEDLLQGEAEKAINSIKPVTDTDGTLLAPNGKPSNLDERTWKMVRTEAFKKWFGDWQSGEVIDELLDENGEPKVLYHGTRSEFTSFDLGKTQQGQEAIFATNNIELATFFTERFEDAGSILPVFMSMKKPLVVDWAERFGDTQFHGDQMRSLIAEAKATGKDSIVAKNMMDVGILADQFIVFSPEQVKSQFNKGTFNPNEKSILYQADKNLLAVHNIKSSKLLDALELGGISMPSLAIIKKDTEFNSFGDITLVSPKDIVAPEKGRSSVYNADIYSPRYPSITYKPNDSEIQKIVEEIYPKINEIGLASKDTYYRDNIPSAYSLISEISSYIKDRGLDGVGGKWLYAYWKNEVKHEKADIKDTLYLKNDEQEEFGEWVKEKFKSAIAEKQIYKGTSNISGRQLYAPYNLENIYNVMKKEAVRNGEDFMYGLPNVRAAVAKKYKTLDQISKDQKKIVSTEQFQKVKEDIDTLWDEIVNEANEAYRYKSDDLSGQDSFAYNLVEGIRHRNIPKEMTEYGFDLKQGTYDKINLLISTLKEMPTEYFEAKVQDIVTFPEFKGAVIPKGTSNKIKDAFTSYGIAIEEYDTENPKSRLEALNRLINRINVHDNILFQSDEDIFREAQTYPSWEEWRDMVKAMSMDESESSQDDAWFKDMWEKANAPTMQTEEGKVALDPEALDERFVERMGDKEQMTQFLSRINDILETKYTYAAMDEEEQAQMQATADLADQIASELTTAFQLNAVRVGRGRELTTRAHKQLLTLIKQSPRDYRALFADIMNEPEYAVADKTVLPEIEDPRTRMAPRLSITQRYALAKRIKNEEIAKKLRTGELVVDADLKEYINSLREETKKLKKDVADATESIQRGNQVIGAQDRKIQELKQAIKDNTKEMRALYRVKAEHERLSKRILKKPGKAINYEQRKQIEEIQKEIKPTIKKKSIEQLRDISSQIKVLRDEGIFQRNIWNLKRQAETSLSRSIINNTIIASGKYRRPPAPGSEEAKRLNKKPKAALKTADLTFLNIERHAMMLDGGKEGKNWELLRKEEIEHRTNYLNNVDKREKPILDYMKKEGIKIEDLSKPFFTMPETGEHFSIDAVLHIQAGSLNDRSREHIAYGNLVSEPERNSMTREEVIEVGDARLAEILKAAEKVPQKYKILRSMILQDYAGENFDRLDQFCISEFNQAIVREENYTPAIVRDITYDSLAGTVAGDLLDLNGGKVPTLPKRGFTKERIPKINPKHQKPIELGLFSTYIKSVEMQERLMEYTPYVRKLNSVYVTGKGANLTRSLIQGAYGSTMIADIDNYIHEIANPSVFIQHDELSKTVRMLRGHLGAAYLGYRVSSVLKQLITSPLPYMAYVNPLELSAASLQVAAKPLETVKFVRDKSSVMRNRSFDVIKEALKQSQKDAPGKLMGKIENIGMKGLEFADTVSVTAGWLAVYKKTLAQTKDEAKAIEQADIITLRTQPSGDPADLSPAFKTKGEAWRVFLQFQAALNVVWQNLRYDLPMMIKNRNYMQAIGTVVGYALAGIGLGFVEDGLDDDDDAKDGLQLLYWAMTQLTDSVPLLGSQFSDLVDSIVTGRKARPFSQSVYPGAEKIISGAQKVTQGEWGKAAQNFMDGFGYMVGAPISAKNEMKRAIGKVEENDISGGVKTILGRREVR